MKKFFLLCSLFILVGLLFPVTVSAHRERLDGWITGKLHIDPDDDPFIGKEAALHLHLSDERGKFLPENCLCEVTILQDDRPVFSQTLTPITTAPVSDIAEQFNFNYAFPSYGQYFVQVRGKPKKGSPFDAFFLNFDMLVERVDSTPIPTQLPSQIPTSKQDIPVVNQIALLSSWSLLAAVGILAIACIFIFTQKSKLKKTKGKK